MAPFDLAVIGQGLAFAEALPQLRAALEGRGVAVVRAQPGAGKTTLAPPAVADLLAGRQGPRRVVVTGPRRVVVQAAARRLASLTGTSVGDLVGCGVDVGAGGGVYSSRPSGASPST